MILDFFLSGAMKTGRQWSKYLSLERRKPTANLKFLKHHKKNQNPRQNRPSFRYARDKEFVTNRPSLQEMLDDILQTEKI